MKFVIDCSSIEGANKINDRMITFQGELLEKGKGSSAIVYKRLNEKEIEVDFTYAGGNFVLDKLMLARFKKRFEAYDNKVQVRIVKNENNNNDQK